MLETNLTFWRMVQARRRQPTIALEELKARLETEALKMEILDRFCGMR